MVQPVLHVHQLGQAIIECPLPLTNITRVGQEIEALARELGLTRPLASPSNASGQAPRPVSLPEPLPGTSGPTLRRVA